MSRLREAGNVTSLHFLNTFPTLLNDFLDSRGGRAKLGARVEVREETRTGQLLSLASTRSSNTLRRRLDSTLSLFPSLPHVTPVGCYHFEDNIYAAAKASWTIRARGGDGAGVYISRLMTGRAWCWRVAGLEHGCRYGVD